jgi:hypothetical protein
MKNSCAVLAGLTDLSRVTFPSGKWSGTARSANSGTKTWLTAVWPSACRECAESDIFNADETGIFFRLTSDRTLKFKREQRVGGKLSKNLITVPVCANVDGAEKRKLLAIGKSKNPKCFKNIKSLPIS